MGPAPEMFDLAIFDLDGTLVDTLPDIAWSLGATLREVGLAAPPLATVRRLVGDGSRALIQRALAEAAVAEDGDRSADHLLPRFAAHYSEHLCVESKLYPGVVEGLEAARASGMAVAVVTNKLGELSRRLLEELAVARFFSAIVGDGDGFPRKPDPTAARVLAERTAAPLRRVAVVGDGLPDVRMARALGAQAIAAAWGYVGEERLRDESPAVIARTPAEAFAALGL